MHCIDADEMYSEILAKRIRELKETQEGVEFMCREMDQIYNDGKEEGIEQTKKETALSMAERGMSLETISQIIKVSENAIQQWINENMKLM